MANQIKVCITGGIGSGKSVVSRILRLKGYSVYDCDCEAKRIMDSSPEIKGEIRRILGENCIDTEGQLNRKAIADIIFADEQKRVALNTIVHRAVRDDFNALCGENSDKVIFIETAIPTTAMISEIADRIWLVDAPEELRIERVSQRNGLNRNDVEKRIASQKAEFDSLPADKTSVIDNNGDSSLLCRISSLLTSL